MPNFYALSNVNKKSSDLLAEKLNYHELMVCELVFISYFILTNFIEWY
jgi:hypothetical protein